MKVEGQYPKLPVQDKNIQKGKEKESVHIERKKPAEVDKIKTNKFTVDRMREKIEAEADINLEKVKALKTKIKKGEYQIDSNKLANNLTRNSLLEDI